MNHDQNLNKDLMERRLALLADKALQGLDESESAELQELDPLVSADSLDLELAAAYVARLDLDESAPLPDWLEKKIEREAAAHLSSNTPESSRPSRARIPFVQQLGWWVAAASIAFTLANLPRPSPPVQSPVTSIEDQLVGSPSARFVNANHPLGRGASGRVVWDSTRQAGYLDLQGLASTDPRKGVYQLWIFDDERDERYPVDGGIFSIDGSSKSTIIPIRPAIEVKRPTLFAVTLEPPGGVVVSDRQRILLTASWDAPGPTKLMNEQRGP